MPDLPGSVEVMRVIYLYSLKMKQTNFSTLRLQTQKVYTRSIINGRLDSQWTVPNEYKKAVLFDGAANGVGTTLNLTESYQNYSLLVISGTYPGGTFAEVSLTSMQIP